MRPLFLPLLANFVITAAVSAQTASYTYIDQKPPYRNANPPMFTARNLPKLGTTFQVEVNQVIWWWYPSPYYILLLGGRNPDVAVPRLNGFLFTSGEIAMPVPYASWNQPKVTMPLAIPNARQLLGLQFYQQVLQIWPGEFVPPSFLLSRGGHGVIGT